jgi:predicted RNA-binding Zn-ribbon protein involved in translation (DUF1610 family)
MINNILIKGLNKEQEAELPAVNEIASCIAELKTMKESSSEDNVMIPSSNSREIYCSDCGALFTRRDGTYTKHIKTMGCRPYKCPKCPKKFVTK